MPFLTLPESVASKRTRRITLIGLIIYTFYGILLTIMIPLFLIVTDVPLQNKIGSTILLLIIVYLIYRDIQKTLKIYETGVAGSKNFQSIVSSIIIGIIVPLLLPIAIYNIILGIHLYKKAKT